MEIIKKETKKSVMYTFTGFSEYYGAYVQGAFYGTFIVPKKYAHKIDQDFELESLLEMHAKKSKYPGIILREHGYVQ